MFFKSWSLLLFLHQIAALFCKFLIISSCFIPLNESLPKRLKADKIGVIHANDHFVDYVKILEDLLLVLNGKGAGVAYVPR